MRTLDKRQRLVLGVLGLVIGAWLIDSFVLRGGPTAANAAPPLAPTVAQGPVPLADDLARLADILNNTVRPPLDPLPPTVARNPFELSDVMYETLIGPRPLANAAQQTAEDADAFQREHELQGVLAGDRPLAVINGVVLAHGEQLDGYTLTACGEDWVELRAGERTLRLVLPDPWRTGASGAESSAD